MEKNKKYDQQEAEIKKMIEKRDITNQALKKLLENLDTGKTHIKNKTRKQKH